MLDLRGARLGRRGPPPFIPPHKGEGGHARCELAVGDAPGLKETELRARLPPPCGEGKGGGVIERIAWRGSLAMLDLRGARLGRRGPPPFIPPHKGEGGHARCELAVGDAPGLKETELRARLPPPCGEGKGGGVIERIAWRGSRARLDLRGARFGRRGPPPFIPPHKGEGVAGAELTVKPSSKVEGRTLRGCPPSPLWGGIQGGGTARDKFILTPSPACISSVPRGRPGGGGRRRGRRRGGAS